IAVRAVTRPGVAGIRHLGRGAAQPERAQRQRERRRLRSLHRGTPPRFVGVADRRRSPSISRSLVRVNVWDEVDATGSARFASSLGLSRPTPQAEAKAQAEALCSQSRRSQPRMTRITDPDARLGVIKSAKSV